MEAVAADKLKKLRNILTDMESVLIAYSGGVDSTFLLRVAQDVLGENAVAVTACSETYTSEEYEEAVQVANMIGAEHITIETQELLNEKFANNPPDRCYYCKTELFSKMVSMAEEKRIRYVVDGANYDDAGDFRPGLQAGAELGVRSPLREAGLTKKEIRQLSQDYSLPTWDKPSAACLSSRFPYGHRITTEKLNQIAMAEKFLKGKGFKQLRVRHHETIARIEVPQENFREIMVPDTLAEIVSTLKGFGFTYVTLDLEGLRSGSMNEVLPAAAG
ncbi:MAG: ATP-dependent sacrificial sulfur transferase LarE [Bacillota bacterium]